MADQDLRQVMNPRLPLAEDVVAHLARMEASGVYSNQGPLVRELERRHAERLGVDAECVVALASGTAALTSAVVTSAATHWRVPAFTFPASAHAVVDAGRVLMLCDVDPQTWQVGCRSWDMPAGCSWDGSRARVAIRSRPRPLSMAGLTSRVNHGIP